MDPINGDLYLVRVTNPAGNWSACVNKRWYYRHVDSPLNWLSYSQGTTSLFIANDVQLFSYDDSNTAAREITDIFPDLSVEITGMLT